MTNNFVTELQRQLALPVIAAPMFIVSNPALVLAQCAAGIVGSMPALNARPQSRLREWLQIIHDGLQDLRSRDPQAPVAPYAINHIIHPSNTRLQADLEDCADFRTPLIITSLSAPGRIVQAVHQWGGKVFHDVTTLRHARKALDAGVDGLILVCAGAGGHAGTLSPFALLGEVRRLYDGPVILSGAITRGDDILAAQAMGADFAYMGTRFIASDEANATQAYKDMLVDSNAADIIYTPYFTGIPGNYLEASIRAAGLEPDALPSTPLRAGPDLATADAKAWRDIWGAGQGTGNIAGVLPVSDIVEQLTHEYQQALQRMSQQQIISSALQD